MLFLLTFSLYAQYDMEHFEVKYGDELPDDKIKIVKIVGESNQKIYALALKKKDYYIKTFDSQSMKLLTTNEIKFSELDGRDVDFEDIYMLNGKVYVIGSVFVRKTKTFHLVASNIQEDGAVNSDGIKLFSEVVKSKSKRGQFNFEIGVDENTLVGFHMLELPKDKTYQYKLKLFDANLVTKFETQEVIVVDDNKKKDFIYGIFDFNLNHADDISFVIKESYRDNVKKVRVENFEIHLFKKANNFRKEIVKIDAQGHFITTCRILSTRNNTLKLVGNFAKTKESGKIKNDNKIEGVYNATIDLNTNTATNVVFNKFTDATKIKLIGERKTKKGKSLSGSYYIKNHVEKKDGGLITISEFSEMHYASGGGIGPLAMNTYTFIYKDLIVNSFNPDGTLQWSNVVPKEQVVSVTHFSLLFGVFGGVDGVGFGGYVGIPLGMLGSGPEYIGFMSFYHDGKLSILINDHIKNKGITNPDDIREMGNHLNAVPSVFTFDENGNVTRTDPEAAIKEELVIRPGVFYRNFSDEYIIYSSRKKNDRLGRLILKN